MKGRESGMPDETAWSSFFDADEVLARLSLASGSSCDVVEFGCGYGTFTFPAAARSRGIVTALDIEPELITLVRSRAATRACANVHATVRDFVDCGTGLTTASQGYAMIFNLLHIEQPLALLREAWRTLAPDGTLAVIHWRSDIDTPRGPPLDIRPTPAQCLAWIREAGFVTPRTIDLAPVAPYHFGLLARRSA